MNQREIVAKALRDQWCGSPWVERDPWETVSAGARKTWLELADVAIAAYLDAALGLAP